MAEYAFCTLFNSLYLIRGIALIESLRATQNQNPIYVLCMDTETYKVLCDLNLPQVQAIPLEKFLDSRLTQIQKERGVGEFCWTCTPFLIEYVFKTSSFKRVIYLDADTYFFSDPDKILKQWPLEQPLMLSRHRYLPEYDQSKNSGIYCVQFNGFDNSNAGKLALNWWKEKCADWCFNRVEPKRFGDQKYLDYIEDECQISAYIPKHPGEGMAPWNSKDIHISQIEKTPMVHVLGSSAVPAIYYHFHGLKLFYDSMVDLCLYYYVLPQTVLQYIYGPYVKHLAQISNQYGWDQKYDWLSDAEEHPKRTAKRQQLGTYYRYKIEDLLTAL
jgi:hypothetical protein